MINISPDIIHMYCITLWFFQGFGLPPSTTTNDNLLLPFPDTLRRKEHANHSVEVSIPNISPIKSTQTSKCDRWTMSCVHLCQIVYFSLNLYSTDRSSFVKQFNTKWPTIHKQFVAVSAKFAWESSTHLGWSWLTFIRLLPPWSHYSRFVNYVAACMYQMCSICLLTSKE